MKPKISIVTVNYNTPRLVLALLRSIQKEGSKIPAEIIAVDNGSSEDSVKILKLMHSAGAIDQLILNDKNLGFAKANNQGIEKAKGKYIFLLNSDTEVTQEAFAKLLEFAEITEDAGVIAPKLLNTNGTVQPSCLSFPTIRMALNEYFFNKKGSFDKFAPKTKHPIPVEAVVGAAILITPKALKRVGTLNEKYFMYFEDIDYCRRVWRSGLKVYYHPYAKVLHHHGESGKNLADSSNQWRRLIPSSKIYHGLVKHYLLTLVLWLGQKWLNLKKRLK